jgi:AcrR family transcriptional regulator
MKTDGLSHTISGRCVSFPVLARSRPSLCAVSQLTERQLRADAQANHKALLSAAVELFSERGAEVTYEEIAQRAGVGRATLYRHFPHREDLLAAILESIIAHLEDVAAELPADETRFIALFRACVELKDRTLPFIDLVTSATPEPTRQRLRVRFEALLAGPLRDAQRAGIVRDDLSPADARVVVLMLSALSDQTQHHGDRTRAIELAEAMLLTASAPTS